MSKKIQNITETAVMLALLIALQALTKPLGQIVTGSCVNAVLAVTALFVGLGGGLTVALISPVCAFALGIAPNFVTVLPIMLGIQPQTPPFLPQTRSHKPPRRYSPTRTAAGSPRRLYPHSRR